MDRERRSIRSAVFVATNKPHRFQLLEEVLLPGLKIAINVLGSIALAQLHDGLRSHLLQQLVAQLGITIQNQTLTMDAA